MLKNGENEKDGRRKNTPVMGGGGGEKPSPPHLPILHVFMFYILQFLI